MKQKSNKYTSTIIFVLGTIALSYCNAFSSDSIQLPHYEILKLESFSLSIYFSEVTGDGKEPKKTPHILSVIDQVGDLCEARFLNTEKRIEKHCPNSDPVVYVVGNYQLLQKCSLSTRPIAAIPGKVSRFDPIDQASMGAPEDTISYLSGEFVNGALDEASGLKRCPVRWHRNERPAKITFQQFCSYDREPSEYGIYLKNCRVYQKDGVEIWYCPSSEKNLNWTLIYHKNTLLKEIADNYGTGYDWNHPTDLIKHDLVGAYTLNGRKFYLFRTGAVLYKDAKGWMYNRRTAVHIVKICD